MEKQLKRIILILLILMTVILTSPISSVTAVQPSSPAYQSDASNQAIISSIWGPTIQQWAPYIAVLADYYGLDPDFIAAVIKEESNGDPSVVSRVGAVGLMGVMPASPGLEWRPPAEELNNASTNLRWGVAILSEIVRQSGGDLAAALAAYSGGWKQASRAVPRQYAASVLNNYGRAVAARSGISPDIASQWTIAVEIRMRDVPAESLLILGDDQPVSGLLTYGEHVVYAYVAQSGEAYYVQGYAVPVALVAPGSDNSLSGSADDLDIQLQARMGQMILKIPTSNPRILAACLPSLSRLRGHVSTRWFAPSYCPSWHR